MKRLASAMTAVLMLGAPSAAAAAEETPICTDRPTKANAVCTVPVGNWQLETTAVGWGRLDSGGARTDAWTVGSSVLKLGLTDHSDLQVGFTPHLDVETRAGGSRSDVSGIGDVIVRYKHRLTGEEAKIQVAAIPFIKLPTAKTGLGNNKVEGGLAVPVSTSAGSATLTFGPELDLLADADDDGRHVAVVNLVNLAGPVAPGLTLVGELWTATNFDPADTVTLASADAGLTYLANDELQLDGGVNFGLSRYSADVELYVGLSIRL